MEVLFVLFLIVVMAGFLAMGYPVAFALPGSAILSIAVASLAGWIVTGDVSAYFSQGAPDQWLTAGVTNLRGIYWEVERDTLIAIPLFIFMGIMLQRSKIAEDLLVTMAQLFGPIPGGLGISVVVVGALLAATTGIVGATVVAMGLISLPVMLRSNYSRPLAAGTISASGTLGQIIPPSIVLIILADQLSSATDQASTVRKQEFREAHGAEPMPSMLDVTSTSAGDMFLGAFLPGLLLVGLYVVFILGFALLRPHAAPAVPHQGRYDVRFALKVLLVLVPPLTLILLVLGSILTGVATVNQAGAIGAAGATIMAGYRLAQSQRGAYRPALLAILSLVALGVLINTFDLNIKNVGDQADSIGIILAAVAVTGLTVSVLWSGWRTWKIEDTLRGVMTETAKTTSMVFIILLGAAMLTAAFRSFGGEELVKDFLGGLPGGFWSQFVVVMAVIFLLGFFLDFIEIAVVVVPIVAPILLADPSANITAVWLGVMIGVNMQTSFLTPPFGFALFYLRGVAPPDVRTTAIYRGVVPFIALQLVGLAIVGTYPPLANYLPMLGHLTAETAPPPQNPRLQVCMEEYLFEIFDTDGPVLRRGIEDMAAQDISILPPQRRERLVTALGLAELTFDRVAEVRRTDAALQAYAEEFAPLHANIRRLKVLLARNRKEIVELEAEGRSGTRDVSDDIAILMSDRAELEARYPEDWTEKEQRYRVLETAEQDARMAYRRTVDGAYDPIHLLLIEFDQADTLAKLTDELRALEHIIANGGGADAISDLSVALSRLDSTDAIRASLRDARRALQKETPEIAGAQAAFEEAMRLADAETVWRKPAEIGLGPVLATYEALIRNSIGVRHRDRLPDELAGTLASCLSNHRDISLHF